MRYIDLRSDTVTRPTPEMREAIHKAEVGDDVFGDDPTVNELEETAAKIMGKEAALLVTSGTQGNAIGVMAHTNRGEAVIIGKSCHIAAHEMGSYAMLAGVSPVFADCDNDIVKRESVERLIIEKCDLANAKTGLICLENALSNGNVAPAQSMEQIYAIASKRNIPVHLDGARIFNAASYLGVPVKELAKNCDSIMFCLSKGLCAPVGSIVAGSARFIEKARILRKILGGGMRQAGILAAAGIIALTKMTQRLHEDHENAVYLAKKLKELPGISLDESMVKINMVFFNTAWPESVVKSFPGEMQKRGIKVLGAGDAFRFVTHNDVTKEDCDVVVSAAANILKGL